MNLPEISFWEYLPGMLIPAIPHLVIWIAVLVVTIIILRRGGGRAEKLLVVGSALLLFSGILLAANFQITMMVLSDIVEGKISVFYEVFNWLREAVSMAGTICFIWGFWLKFKTRGVPEKGSNAQWN